MNFQYYYRGDAYGRRKDNASHIPARCRLEKHQLTLEMKPIAYNDLETHPKVFQDRFQILNMSLATISYLSAIVSCFGVDSIRTFSGRSLPSEIWFMILNFLKLLAENTPNFALVKTTIVPCSVLPSNSKLLRSVRYHVDPDDQRPLNQNVASRTQVMSYHVRCRLRLTLQAAAALGGEFIATPHIREQYEYLLLADALSERSGPGSVFYTVVHELITPLVRQPMPSSGIYCQVSVPDIISRIDNGWCFECKGGRLVADHLTWASEVFGRACPVCMGLEFATEHLLFRNRQPSGERHYEGLEMEREEQDMDRRFAERLAELCYDPKPAKIMW